MSKRTLLMLFLIVVLGAASTVFAITNGQPDGNNHPYVGLAHNFEFACSGAAITPTVFVTAAHCFGFSGEPVVVTFDPDGLFAANPVFHSGTWYPDPNWCIGCGPGLPGFDTHDWAVIVFDQPVALDRYASLPYAGVVDSLPMNTAIDLVGYGVQWDTGGGPPVPEGLFTRYYAATELIASNHVHSAEFIKLRANPSQGSGGTCFGDSGGPNLLAGTDMILAVNSYVTNGQCAGVTYSNRIDRADALAFIESYLP